MIMSIFLDFEFSWKRYKIRPWMTINFADSSIASDSLGADIEGSGKESKNAFVGI
jgi:hypothetical protein